MTIHYSLAVVTSADGFIARTPDHPPQAWASAEEQAVFFAHVEAADWAIMGRNTHLAAERPDRRRIVLSTGGGAGDWRRHNQLWVDPATTRPAQLPDLVASVAALRTGLILGGTRVHDWFVTHNAINTVFLTIEPVSFHDGLPIFSAHPNAQNPLAIFQAKGFTVRSEELLTPAGTRYITLDRRPR